MTIKSAGRSSKANNSFPLNNGGALGQFNQAKPSIGIISDSRGFLDHAVGVATNDPYTTTYRFNNGIISKIQSLTNEIYNWKYQFNSGVSGDTAQGIDNRKATSIPRTMRKRPAYEDWDWFYFVGINDAIAGITANTHLGFFYSTIRYMQEQGARNIFVLGDIPYPDGYGSESAATHITRIGLLKAYNAGKKAYCEITPGVHYIDNYNDYGNGADVPPAAWNMADIHQGSVGADIIAKNSAVSVIANRGKNQTSPGITLNQNPKLIGVENITNGGGADGYYCDGRTAGILSVRNAGQDPIRVTMDATDGVAKFFSFFSNSGSIPDTLMPGDIVQGCIEAEHIEVVGLPDPVYGWIRASTSPNENAYINYQTGGYGKGVLTGMGKQLFMSDPWTVPAGRGGVIMQPCFRANVPINTKLVFDLYDLSCRRLFVSPNGEYSAASLIPPHRTNVSFLSNTAAGSIQLQLYPIAEIEDGWEQTFLDVQGNASVKTLTIRGGTIDLYAPNWVANTNYGVNAVVANSGGWYICTTQGLSAGSGGPTGTGTGIVDNIARWSYRPVDRIMNGAAAAETIVLNTNYFRKTFKANKGLNAWVAIN